MKWLKGVVMLIIDENVHIELENGRKAWATPHFKLNIREHVLVAWDYTNNCIGTVSTAERLKTMPTERYKVEAKMVDVFQSPLGDMSEEELNDVVETSDKEMPTGKDTQEIDVRSFPNPLGEDEGVDRDSMVDLRDDIKS